MSLCIGNTAKTLEDRLLKQGFCLGLLVVFLLSLFDFFYTHEYDSVILEIVAAVFFLAMIFVTRNRQTSYRERLFFSFFIIVVVNVAWLISSISVINIGVFFLAWSLVLIIHDTRFQPFLFAIIFLNLALLFFYEYFIFNQYTLQDIGTVSITESYIGAFLFYIFGFYLIEFLKNSYNRERDGLSKANLQLKEQTDEIAAQNEELRSVGEQMDEANVRLQKQKEELIKIKDTLEQTVEKRTEYLQKANEKLLEQNQQLEQYAYITSHNLRAPIAQIQGLVSLLGKSEHDEAQRQEIVERIANSTAQLHQVVNDLGTILRVKQNLNQAWENVDVVKEIKQIVQSLKGPVSEKNISIQLPKIDSLPVRGIRAYIYSILHNLIENAVKYSDPAKESFIKFETEELPDYHKISIIDNGIGMDMDAASGRIFQMYQRFNTTHPGQGFGLFLVKTQIEAMDGRIEVDSVHGQGTAFHLYFPKQG